MSQLDLIGPENFVVYDQEIVFTPLPQQVGQPLNLAFRSWRSAAASVYPSEVWFDNIRLEIETIIVPEPASGLLTAIGMAVFGTFGFRRVRRRPEC
jgi:hypothetical protein